MTLLPINLTNVLQNPNNQEAFTPEQESTLGTTGYLTVSSIALMIFNHPLFQTIALGGFGFAAGILVKKALSRYTSCIPLERSLAIFEEEHRFVKPLVAITACVSSFCCPIFAAILAASTGFESGFSYRAKALSGNSST